MELSDKKIIFAADYAAPYKGNFINSLEALERELVKRGNTVLYVFPDKVKQRGWFNEFQAKHQCSTTGAKRKSEFTAIVESFKPDLIHTHFEGYDEASAYATKVYRKKHAKRIKLVWHMHDWLSFMKNPIKALYQAFCYYKHYNLYGRNDVSIIAVNRHELKFAQRFKKFFGRDFKYSSIIPNGVDLNRLSSRANAETHSPFTFLAFWGRLIQKRVDILIDACRILLDKGYNFRLVITEGSNLSDWINKNLDTPPSWLNIVKHNSNINELFAQSDCFVSTSIFETFSYAVCEASIYGLPVIQSNIEGTEWNESNPSTFTFKSKQIDDLVKKMIEVIEYDKPKLYKQCLISRANNIQNFSLEAWVNKVIDFYRMIE